MKVFFVTREEIKNPFVAQIIDAGKKLHECGVRVKSISMRYGKRMLITAAGANIHKLSNEDFIEVVDYNPVGDIMLVIGLKAPPEEAIIHWFIYKREEINAVIYVGGEIKEGNTMGVVAEILKALRKGNLINVGENVISVGRSLKEAVEELKCL